MTTARSRRTNKTKSYVDDDLDDIPLKSIKKETKPEETVSMERYYFGQIGGNGDFVKTAIAVEVSSIFLFINEIHTKARG